MLTLLVVLPLLLLPLLLLLTPSPVRLVVVLIVPPLLPRGKGETRGAEEKTAVGPDGVAMTSRLAAMMTPARYLLTRMRRQPFGTTMRRVWVRKARDTHPTGAVEGTTGGGASTVSMATMATTMSRITD